jgi:hypothetical protein
LNVFFSVKEQMMPPWQAGILAETALTEKPDISLPFASLIKTQIFSC